LPGARLACQEPPKILNRKVKAAIVVSFFYSFEIAKAFNYRKE
jgi:hypothetical protein